MGEDVGSLSLGLSKEDKTRQNKGPKIGNTLSRIVDSKHKGSQ